MCGIAGIVSVDPTLDVTQSVARMTARLQHRGPNAHGAFVRRYAEATVGLGHSRLSILDLSSAGSQPMNSADGRRWITYNGEVYNFQKVREELESQGRQFRSRSDTEVVLEALSMWGLSALSRMRGMFALALWDEESQTLTLARDPFGIKPLYYSRNGTTFLFASELRALLATGIVSKTLNRRGLESFLRTGSVEAPYTIVEGVQCLMPGQQMQITLRGRLQVAEPAPYQSVPLTQSHGFHRREEAVEELTRLLTESVRLHCISDVPLGVFLSGGIDSSALVALLNRAKAPQPKTFSVVFAEKQFSELTHARTVADHFGTDHREIFLSEQRLLAELPEALTALDQPSTDGFNTYIVSKGVKEAGVTVALSGLGGDELFGGYDSFRRANLLRKITAVPQPVRGAVADIGRTFFNGSVKRSKFWDFLQSDGSAAAGYNISRQLFSPLEIRRFGVAVQAPRVWPPLPESRDTINAVSNLELQGYMANTLLRDADAMSMAHSLEIRVPFVDSTVADFVLSVPGAWKVDQSKPKSLLLDALQGELPSSIWNRRKMGFSLPFERWMRCALRREVGNAFRASDGFRTIGLEPKEANAIWRNFLTQPGLERWSRPWALYIIRQWCDRNGVSL